MSLSKHNYIPEEILSEILKRLPVKYVLRCGAVQKSWYSFVRTPMFISLHSNYQKLTSHINPKYLLFCNNAVNNAVMTVRSDDAHCREYCTFNYPHDLPFTFSSWYAQSNGLICVSNGINLMFNSEQPDYDPDIFIWNPLVQKFKTLPDSPLATFKFEEFNWNALAFGFFPEVNDYVVVHVVKPSVTSARDVAQYDEDYEYPHTVVIGIYSLNTNSWRKICQDKVFVDCIETDRSVFVNGTAFWVVDNSMLGELVMYFDTKTNILGQVEVPPWIAHHGSVQETPLILPFGQSVAYFIEVDQEDVDQDDDGYGSPHLDIWVLKDEMVDEFSWEKRMSVVLSENVQAEVLGLRNTNEPLLAKANRLISYDLDTHEPYDFVASIPYRYRVKDYRSPYIISPFVETLLLLDID